MVNSDVQYTGNTRGKDTRGKECVMTYPLRLVLVLLLSGVSAGWAGSAPEEHAAGAASQSESEPEPDLCEQEPSSDHLPEQMQAGVHEFSCRTVRWIDSWFGDSEDFDEAAVSGKLKVSTSWNEFDHFEPRIRYRVRSDLPNFSSRWNAFLGRVDEEAFISNTETFEDRAIKQGIADRDDPEWLLGLGYRDKPGTQGWDYSIGIRLRTPPRAYVKARYRRQYQLRPDLDLRFNQTIFWRDGIGFGTTTHVDSARDIGGTDLVRWELLATISEETEGTRWWAGNTWYHRQTPKHGISLLTFARGETGKSVSLHEYGFELTWRRRVAREWLYFNFGPTLTWPREEPEQKREASWGFAVSMDFEFGEGRR